jgi:hypothetical protein
MLLRVVAIVFALIETIYPFMHGTRLKGAFTGIFMLLLLV